MRSLSTPFLGLSKLAWLGIATLGVLTLMTLTPVSALAADFHHGQSITVGPGETINDDIYAFGSSIDIAGTVNGNVIAAGSSITISGTVTKDVMAAGSTIEIPGQVQGSIRAAGSVISVGGSIDNDLVAAGSNIGLSAKGKVGRDLVAAGQTVTVAGPVARHVKLRAADVTLSAPVGGDVTGDVQSLRLATGATIAGKLDYTSNRNVTIDHGASILGPIHRTTPPPERQPSALEVIIGWVRTLVGFFVLGALLILLLPGFDRTARQAIVRPPWGRLGIGFLLLVLTPIVAALVFGLGLIVGGWWIGVFLFFLYAIAGAAAFVEASLMLGHWGLERLGQPGVHPLLALLAGVTILTLVGLIPVLGWLIGLVAIVYGLGILAVALHGAIRPRPTAPLETSAT